MSIFFIGIIASKTRLAAAESEPKTAFISTAGVICEVVKESGEMAKGSKMLDDLSQPIRQQQDTLAHEHRRAREDLQRSHQAEVAAWQKDYEAEKAKLRDNGGKAPER